MLHVQTIIIKKLKWTHIHLLINNNNHSSTCKHYICVYDKVYKSTVQDECIWMYTWVDNIQINDLLMSKYVPHTGMLLVSSVCTIAFDSQLTIIRKRVPPVYLIWFLYGKCSGVEHTYKGTSVNWFKFIILENQTIQKLFLN